MPQVLADEIPEKQELLLHVELTSAQRSLYRGLLEANAAAIAKEQQQRDGAVGGGGGGRAGAPSLATVCVKLRQLCNHPQLLEKAEAPLPRMDDARAVSRAVERLVKPSGKMQLLHKLLPRLRAEGRKLLIFSQVTHASHSLSRPTPNPTPPH